MTETQAWMIVVALCVIIYMLERLEKRLVNLYRVTINPEDTE